MTTSILTGKLLGFVSIKSRIFKCSFKLYLNISKNISAAAKIIFEAKAAWQMLKFYCKCSLLIRNITANLTFKFLNARFTLFLRWLFSCEKKTYFPSKRKEHLTMLDDWLYQHYHFVGNENFADTNNAKK